VGEYNSGEKEDKDRSVLESVAAVIGRGMDNLAKKFDVFEEKQLKKTPGSGNPSRKKRSKVDLFEADLSSDEDHHVDTDLGMGSASLDHQDAKKDLVESIKAADEKVGRVAYEKRVKYEEGVMMEKKEFIDLKGSTVKENVVKVATAQLEAFIEAEWTVLEVQASRNYVEECVRLYKSCAAAQKTFTEWFESNGLALVGPPMPTKTTWLLMGVLVLYRHRHPKGAGAPAMSSAAGGA